jgi:thioredoxin-related protein
MSVKTFNDTKVKKILDEHFVFVELDVEKEKDAAGWFASSAIPDT